MLLSQETRMSVALEDSNLRGQTQPLVIALYNTYMQPIMLIATIVKVGFLPHLQVMTPSAVTYPFVTQILSTYNLYVKLVLSAEVAVHLGFADLLCGAVWQEFTIFRSILFIIFVRDICIYNSLFWYYFTILCVLFVLTCVCACMAIGQDVKHFLLYKYGIIIIIQVSRTHC